MVLTPLSGNPSLFVQFRCRPLASETTPTGTSDSDCNSTGADALMSTQDDGVERISIKPSDPGFCSPPCTLYVAVRGETDCSFSILVTQRAFGVTALVNGQPQAGVVDSDKTAYYSLTVNMTHGLVVWLTAFEGSPTLIYSSDLAAPLPTASSYTGDRVDSSSPLRLPAQPGMITYRFGVYGENGGANFALLARSGGGQSLIVDNVPTVGQVFAGETALYKIHVPATASTFPQLYVTALQGSVRVLMSVNGATPTEASHAQGATAAPEWPARLPLSPGALNIVAVSHFSSSAASFATFSLLAVVEPGSSALLLDGWPQSLEVQSGEAAFMRFIIPSAGQKVVLTARLADHASPRSTLSLRASALDPRAQHLLSCTGRDCHSATSPPGADSVSLVLQEDACSSRCLLHIALSSSDAANVTVIASTQTGDVQLQLGIVRDAWGPNSQKEATCLAGCLPRASCPDSALYMPIESRYRSLGAVL